MNAVLTPAAITAHIAGIAPVAREAIRVKPASNAPDTPAMEKLYGAYENLVGDIGSGRKPQQIELESRVPEDNLRSKIDAALNTTDYFSSGQTAGGNAFINFNPNADSAVLAHEMGHIAAQHTDAGKLINNLRHTPALRNSIAQAALLTLPAGAFAALNAGDEDIDEGMALSALVASPIIADEINATRHGLDIMDRAGMKATAGQRAKLAGGLVSYLAAPLIAGGVAANVGNIFDEDVVMMPE